MDEKYKMLWGREGTPLTCHRNNLGHTRPPLQGVVGAGGTPVYYAACPYCLFKIKAYSETARNQHTSRCGNVDIFHKNSKTITRRKKCLKQKMCISMRSITFV